MLQWWRWLHLSESKAGTLNLTSPHFPPPSGHSLKQESRLFQKGCPSGQAQVKYRKELGSAQCNQNLSSNCKSAFCFRLHFFFFFCVSGGAVLAEVLHAGLSCSLCQACSKHLNKTSTSVLLYHTADLIRFYFSKEYALNNQTPWEYKQTIQKRKNEDLLQVNCFSPPNKFSI